MYLLTINRDEEEISGYRDALALIHESYEYMDLFKKYNVFEYPASCYDVLHTTGREYIIEDIDKYINARKKTA